MNNYYSSRSRHIFLATAVLYYLLCFLCLIDATKAVDLVRERASTSLSNSLKDVKDFNETAISITQDHSSDALLNNKVELDGVFMKGGTMNNDEKEVDLFTKISKTQKTSLIVKRGETQNIPEADDRNNDSQTNEINSAATTHVTETKKDNLTTQTNNKITSISTSTKIEDQTSTPTTNKPTPTNDQKEVSNIASTYSSNLDHTATTSSTKGTVLTKISPTATISDQPSTTTKESSETLASTTTTVEALQTTSGSTTIISGTEDHIITITTTTQKESTTTIAAKEESTSTIKSTSFKTSVDSTTAYTTTTISSTFNEPSSTLVASITTDYSSNPTTTITTTEEEKSFLITTVEATSDTTNTATLTQEPYPSLTDTPIIATTMEQPTVSSDSSSYNSLTSATIAHTVITSEIVEATVVASQSFTINTMTTTSAKDMALSYQTLSQASTSVPSLGGNANSPTSLSNATQTVNSPTSTRSFLVTSSTATPFLILGTKECTGDSSAIDGKCPNEYFCNAAKRTCVLLLADGEQCFEDFQCASTYCTTGICGREEKKSSATNSGGKIAGAAIGGIVGAALIVFGLIRWRKRSRTIGRRMNQFHRNNNIPSFYDATTTIVPETRLSKYNFLQQMLEPHQQQMQSSQTNSSPVFHQIPIAASERVRSRQTMQQENYNPFRYPVNVNHDWNNENADDRNAYQYI